MRISFAFAALLSALLYPSVAAVPSPQPKRLPLAAFTRSDDHTTVRVRVPAGIQKVVLSTRASVASEWADEIVAPLDGRAQVIKFVIKRRLSPSMIRITGEDASDPAQSEAFVDESPETTYGYLFAATGGMLASEDGKASVTLAGSQSTVTHTIQESDIWKQRGDTLFFFNQYRGLQVLDLSDPDAPVLTGEMRLPTEGEEMYLLPRNHVALVTTPWSARQLGNSEAEIILVDASSPQPKEVARMPVSGWVLESRLVGSILYVAAQTYTPGGGTRVELHSFNLADPAHPVAVGSKHLSGWAHFITATDRSLFVGTYAGSYAHSTVSVFDIAAGDGSMIPRATLNASGYVADKFKISERGSVVSVVSHVSGGFGTGAARSVTVVENFDLGAPGAPLKGRLSLGQGEQLFATRFDGDRLYVVTFFQIDPLWIVDLKDPTAPKIAGDLEIPGFSTYLEPLGDRLVAVGTVDGSVALCLFDVHDPARPVKLTQLKLGSWSWSESQSNEKALKILPEEGLILLPVSEHTELGFGTRVQLVDLHRNSLVPRGVIEHGMTARRATVHRDHVIAISGTSLLSVDASDRDHPVVKADVILAWPVDRVIASGNFLLQVGRFVSERPTITVTAKASPDVALHEIALPEGNVVGTTLQDGRLYVLQLDPGWWSSDVLFIARIGGVRAPVPATLTVVDLAALPLLSVAGVTRTEETFSISGEAQPLWLENGSLVFSVLENQFDGRRFGGAIMPPIGVRTLASATSSTATTIRPNFFAMKMTQHFLAFDVSNPAAPELSSHAKLGGADIVLREEIRRSFSKPVAVGNSVFVSHRSEYLQDYVPSPPVYDAKGRRVFTSDDIPASGRWTTRNLLNQLDFTNAAAPVKAKPVNFPGALIGVAAGQSTFFSVGSQGSTANHASTVHLQASRLVSGEVLILDAQPLSATAPIVPSKAVTNGNTIFVSGPDALGLEVWQFASDSLSRLAARSLFAGALHLYGDLLVAASGDTLSFFDASVPSSLTLIKKVEPPMYWNNLMAADAVLGDAFWMPLGLHGVETISLTPSSAPAE